MFFDTIRLLVHNENWPKANLHVTKENKSFKKKKYIYICSLCLESDGCHRCAESKEWTEWAATSWPFVMAFDRLC